MLFSVIRSLFSGGSVDFMSILMQIVAVLFVIFCILPLHEFAHGWVAYKLGDNTAKYQGRLTFNPIASVDPLGALFLLLFGFGWAKPVPVNPRNFENQRRDEIVVSLAGIAVNFVLAFVFYGLWYILFTVCGIRNLPLMRIITYFFIINLNLMIFNLIPIFPLDGYHVFKNLCMRTLGFRFFNFMERYGTLILIVLLMSNTISIVMSWCSNQIIEGFRIVFSAIFG